MFVSLVVMAAGRVGKMEVGLVAVDLVGRWRRGEEMEDDCLLTVGRWVGPMDVTGFGLFIGVVTPLVAMVIGFVAMVTALTVLLVAMAMSLVSVMVVEVKMSLAVVKTADGLEITGGFLEAAKLVGEGREMGTEVAEEGERVSDWVCGEGIFVEGGEEVEGEGVVSDGCGDSGCREEEMGAAAVAVAVAEGDEREGDRDDVMTAVLDSEWLTTSVWWLLGSWSSSDTSTLTPTKHSTSSSTTPTDPTSSISTTTPGNSSISMATISMATFSIAGSSPILFGVVVPEVPLWPLEVPLWSLEVPLWFGVDSAVVSSSLIISSSFPSSSSNRYMGIS